MSKILPVVWHDQRNNTIAPHGTCNATSIAMIMQYKGLLAGWDKEGQLDDFVTRHLDTPDAWEIHKKTMPTDWRNYNPRNNPFVLKWYFNSIGIDDNFIQLSKNDNAIQLIKNCINRDMPVIMTGNYTRKRTNGTQDVITHINVAVGYDDNNIIVNDPFGSMLNYYLPFPNDGDHVVVPNEFLKEHITQLHILSV